jgi:hypothetical protein
VANSNLTTRVALIYLILDVSMISEGLTELEQRNWRMAVQPE